MDGAERGDECVGEGAHAQPVGTPKPNLVEMCSWAARRLPRIRSFVASPPDGSIVENSLIFREAAFNHDS
jgi:hypothetical protein